MERAEKVRVELQERYTNNFIFLRERAPKIFKKVLEDGKTDWKVVIDERGFPNAIINDSPLYPGNPEDIAMQQVEIFSENPIRLVGNLSSRTLRKDLIHGKYGIKLSTLWNKYKPYSLDSGKFWDGKNIPVLIVLGTGFGYHIKELIDRFNIQHMVIVDLNPDLFKLSLYTLDWRKLFSYFSNLEKRRSLRIILEDDEKKLASSVEAYLAKVCPAFISHIFVFRHMNSPVFDKFESILVDTLKETQMMWGFFDDELWSLEYTIKNATRKIPIYMGSKKTRDDTPVFLVGSGPSLDQSIEVVKRFREKAIVVSCGTAIKPLEKAGIKPDMHLEIERTKLTYDALKVVNEEFLRGIPFVAFNNVYPKAFDFFDRRFLFLKPNDAGSVIFPRHIPRIYRSNPTVTAGAFSLLVNAGFKRFFLFGIDLGSKSPEYHHSKASIYYEDNAPKTLDMDIKVEGNFGGEVWTNEILFQNKRIMEMVIESMGDLEVYNVSDGALIKGAAPLRFEEVEGKLREGINKEESLNSFFLSFSEEPYKHIDIKSFLTSLEEDMKAYVERFSHLHVKTPNIEELMKLLSDMQLFVYDLAIGRRISGEYVLYTLILPSIRQYAAEIFSNALTIPDDNKRLSYLNKALGIVSEFLEEAHDAVINLKKKLKMPI